MSDSGAAVVFVSMLLVGLIIVGFLLWILVVIGRMARKRGRNAFFWVLLSIFTTPIFPAILLLCLGETDECRKSRIIEEETLRLAARMKLSNDNTDSLYRDNSDNRKIKDEKMREEQKRKEEQERKIRERAERENSERFMPK